MRKLLVSVLAAILVLAAMGPPAARADEPADVKILAAVSVGGIDRIKADVGLLGEMAGQKDALKMAEGMLSLMTQGKGLVGVDAKRPWGMLVGTDGEEIGGCAFVPVTDLCGLMGLAKKMAKGKIEELDDGIYAVNGPRKTVYVQETHEGWAFIVDDMEIFKYVPADPAAVLAGLDEKYDVAVRLFPANIPAEHREKIAAKMRECAAKCAQKRETCFKKLGRCNDEHVQAIRKIIHAKICKDLQQVADDMEELTFGWTLDEKAANAALEVSMVARKGTPTAKFLAGADRVTTAFGGFQLPDALVSFRASGSHPPLSAKDLDAVVEAMRARGYAKVERKAKSAEEKKVGKQIVDGFLDVFQSTAAKGKDDLAGSLRLHTDAVTYVGGRYVADGPKLEATVKKLVAAVAERHPDCVEKFVTLDAAKFQGVNFHVVSLPIPEKCPRHDKAVAAVGEEFTLVLGIGKEAVYISAGRDAAKMLKRAIRKSKKAGRKPVPPMRVTLDLGELAELATECPVERVSSKAEKALEIFEKADGADQIRATLVPIKRGLKFRVEIDEGLLRLAAVARSHRHHHGHDKDHGHKK